MINSMLYKKIPDTDVRKGWWVDENLHSPLLEAISWNGASGDDLAKLEIDDVKLAFTPYTNVKFECEVWYEGWYRFREQHQRLSFDAC